MDYGRIIACDLDGSVQLAEAHGGEQRCARGTVSYDHRFEEVRTTPLLILDDLGTQSMTPWVREKLYQLFNYRYNAELPTVITTANVLDEIDPRLVSRMLDTRLCTIYGITVPSYRGGAPRRKRAR